MLDMLIEDACEKNLKHVSLTLPKHKFIAFTGVSGSGKSTLAKDVIYMECQRQYLEAISLQGIPKANVKYVKNTSPAIMITQQGYHKNPRSSLGTMTNIYTDLRMLYEKIGIRQCPCCNVWIDPSTCLEEVEKHGSEFNVFLFCSHCHERIPALTRTHFSFNTREGACEKCHGMGTILKPNISTIISEDLSLETGGVTFFEKRYGEYQCEIFYKALQHYQIPLKKGTPIKEYSPLQKEILLHGVQSLTVHEQFPTIKQVKNVSDGKFEGVIPILYRRISQNDNAKTTYKKYMSACVCDACEGERLQEESRLVHIQQTRLPQLVHKTLDALYCWMQEIKHTITQTQLLRVKDYILDIETKIHRLQRLGLGYLSLDRQAMSLSGGESQRLKLAAALDSEVTGILYILDEPTIGLHPKDTQGIIQILKELKEHDNTLIVIEHDIDVIKEADHIIELGPFAGIHGGKITAQGTWQEVKQSNSSLLYKDYITPIKQNVRIATQYIEIHDAYLHNLKHINVKLPLHVFTCITGVSGSGKSTLIFDVLANSFHTATGCELMNGSENIDEIISITQGGILRSRRSNVATYCALYDEIRTLYANSEAAKQNNLQPSHFSFNVKGGRCEACEGLGYVTSNLLFFEDVEVACPHCHGQRFQEQILSVKIKDKSIMDVLQMSVEEAITHFYSYPKILRFLNLLANVGLSYITLGQSLTTLSGGEIQRLKLAKELLIKKKKHTLYIMDEPTTGLHPYDIKHFNTLLQSLVEEGNSVIVVEHNLQLISQADWIIDLGKEGGEMGGTIIAQGTPQQIMNCAQSYTGQYLKKSQLP